MSMLLNASISAKMLCRAESQLQLFWETWKQEALGTEPHADTWKPGLVRRPEPLLGLGSSNSLSINKK